MRFSKAAAAAFALAMLVNASAADLRAGDIPPDYLGRDRAGDDITLGALRGKVVIVTFWASWCGYCRRELPVLEQVQRHVSADRLRVIAVNFKEDRDTFRAMLRKLKGWQTTFTRDGDGRIGHDFGVNALPHMYIVGADGTIAFTDEGYSEGDLPQIVNEINRVLAAQMEARQAPSGDRPGT